MSPFYTNQEVRSMQNQLFNTHIENSHTNNSDEIKSKTFNGLAEKNVWISRKEIEHILGQDHRKFIVVGPCSIHDIKAAEEFRKT